MNIDKQNEHLIVNTAEAKGLEAFPHRFPEDGSDMYEISVYGIDNVDRFEFYWDSRSQNIEYRVVMFLEGIKINEDISHQLFNMFSVDRALFKSLSVDNKKSMIALKGSFKKESNNKVFIEDIIDYFKYKGAAIGSFVDSLSASGEDNKHKQ